MNVGIICEGTTDYEVLTAVVKKIIAPKIPTFTLLQPDGDRLATPASGPVSSGWQAVRKFLQTSEAGLWIGRFDLVIVHVERARCHRNRKLCGAPTKPGSSLSSPRPVDALPRSTSAS